MQLKPDKIIFKLTLVILVTVAIQDVFIDRYSPYRIITQLTQLLGVIIGFWGLYRFLIKKSSYQFSFNKWFICFFFLLFIYALFSKYVFDWYPRVLYTLLPFFVFYNAAKKGHITEQAIKKLALFLFIPALILLYQSFFERAEAYGSFMERADNVGYSLLAIMMLFSILKPTKVNFIFITVAFFATLLSLKRGAMITGSIIYIFFILNYRKQALKKFSFANFFIFLSIFSGSVFAIIKYSDVFLYRFIKDPGGSGRDRFFTLIWEGWNNSAFHNQLFGNGFFSTIDYLDKSFRHPIYAHSDWLEILYDHGLLGIILFSGMFFSLFIIRGKIKKFSPQLYLPYLALIVVLFIKAVISGTYMTKFDAVTYGIIGLILGQLYYKINATNPKNINNA